MKTAADATATIRVPARVTECVMTSQAAADPASDPLAAGLVAKLRSGRRYADRSTGVHLTEDERAVLQEYASTLAEVARDSIAIDPGSLGDFNAAQACLRRLHTPRS